MPFDYYAFRREKLTATFSEMEEAYAEFKEAADKDAKRKAEDKIKAAAGAAVDINPHMAFLWYEANNSELSNRIRDAWRSKQTVKSIPASFRFHPEIASADLLPHLSFVLCVPFRLRKPYLSRDERDFYLLDNPVRKEKVFQVPMVASTSWKGVLRGVMSAEVAAWWNGLDGQSRAERKCCKEFVRKRLQLGRLFGNERGAQPEDKAADLYLDKTGGGRLARLYRRYVRRFLAAHGFFAGRLHFYSTFFEKNKVVLEVINPHNRAKGIGERPILMESVPAQADGDLVIAYLPFGPIDQSEEKRRAEVAQDIIALCEGIQAMLTVYGFGAKTSSGFGIAEDKLARPGTLAVRAALPNLALGPAAEAKPKHEPLPRYLDSASSLHQDFRDAAGGLKSEAEYQALLKTRGQQYGKKDQQLYEKARKWWEQRQVQAAAESSHKPEAEIPKPEPSPVARIAFDSLTKLREAAKSMNAALLGGATA